MTERNRRAIPAHAHDAAGRWLARRQGEVPPQVEREFRAWLDADPVHRDAYQEAAQNWRDSMMLADSTVGRNRQLPRAPVLLRHRTHVAAAGLGLAVLIGAVAVGMVGEGDRFALGSPAEAAIYRTAVGEIRTIQLPDGSKVTLDTKSVLRVAYTGRSRRLTLEQGRGRFDMSRDAMRPFLVMVPGGNVVGASGLFDVDLGQGSAQVTALQGRVELRGGGSDIASADKIVAAGQRSVLGDQAAVRPARRSDAQWTSGMLALEATPLGDAVAEINRYNDVQLRLADQRLGRLAISGAFRVREPELFAKAATRMFGLNMTRSGTDTILLTRGSPVLPPALQK